MTAKTAKTAKTTKTTKTSETTSKVPGKDGRLIGVGDKVKRWCPLWDTFKTSRKITDIDGDRVLLHYLDANGDVVGEDGWYIAAYEVQLDD